MVGTYCVLNCVKLSAFLIKPKIFKATWRPFRHLILILGRYTFIKHFSFVFVVLTVHNNNLFEKVWCKTQVKYVLVLGTIF